MRSALAVACMAVVFMAVPGCAGPSKPAPSTPTPTPKPTGPTVTKVGLDYYELSMFCDGTTRVLVASGEGEAIVTIPNSTQCGGTG